jgi:hypothetical protein
VTAFQLSRDEKKVDGNIWKMLHRVRFSVKSHFLVHMSLARPRLNEGANWRVWFDEGRFYLARGDDDKWFLSRDFFTGSEPLFQLTHKDRLKFYPDLQARLRDCPNSELDVTWDSQEECYVLRVRTYFCCMPGRILLYDYYT